MRGGEFCAVVRRGVDVVAELTRLAQPSTSSKLPFLLQVRDGLAAELDAALFAGNAPWPGTEYVGLMRETLVAVASPMRLGERQRLIAIEVKRLPMLPMATRLHAWRTWFESQGAAHDGALVGPRRDQFSMLTEAAVRGMGAAPLPQLLIQEELRDGRLVVLLEHPHESRHVYSLIYPKPKQTCRHWLLCASGWWRRPRPIRREADRTTAPGCRHGCLPLRDRGACV
mgnify:CR=1 FL=1